MRPKPMFILTIMFLIILSAQIQDGRTQPNPKEIRLDRKDLVSSAVNLADDRRDMDRLSDLIMRWDVLRKAGNSAELEAVERMIADELRHDLKETVVESHQADKEVHQAVAEKNASRRDLRREKHDADHDRKDLKDERRDLHDDRRDLKKEARDEKKIDELLAKKREVAGQLIALQKEIDLPGKAGDKLLQNKQLTLLEEYLALSSEEVKLGIREKVEDRHEMHEDRQERREERRD